LNNQSISHRAFHRQHHHRLVPAGIGIIVASRWPEPKRKQPFYSAIENGVARTRGPQSTFDYIRRRPK
jgi:hypothetical protein